MLNQVGRVHLLLLMVVRSEPQVKYIRLIEELSMFYRFLLICRALFHTFSGVAVITFPQTIVPLDLDVCTTAVFLL